MRGLLVIVLILSLDADLTYSNLHRRLTQTPLEHHSLRNLLDDPQARAESSRALAHMQRNGRKHWDAHLAAPCLPALLWDPLLGPRLLDTSEQARPLIVWGRAAFQHALQRTLQESSGRPSQSKPAHWSPPAIDAARCSKVCGSLALLGLMLCAAAMEGAAVGAGVAWATCLLRPA